MCWGVVGIFWGSWWGSLCLVSGRGGGCGWIKGLEGGEEGLGEVGREGSG